MKCLKCDWTLVNFEGDWEPGEDYDFAQRVEEIMADEAEGRPRKGWSGAEVISIGRKREPRE